MSGGGSKTEYVTTQSNTGAPAYAQPFLEYGLEQAREQYDSSEPEYFPGQTFVDFSPQTEQALRQTEARALAGSPLQQEALGQAMSTVRGDYVGAANPYRDQAIQSAMEPVISSVGSAFSGGGRFNSGLFACQRLTAAFVRPVSSLRKRHEPAQCQDWEKTASCQHSGFLVGQYHRKSPGQAQPSRRRREQKPPPTRC